MFVIIPNVRDKLNKSKAKAYHANKANTDEWQERKAKAIKMLLAGASVRSVRERCEMSDTTARKLKNNLPSRRAGGWVSITP